MKKYKKKIINKKKNEKIYTKNNLKNNTKIEFYFKMFIGQKMN